METEDKKSEWINEDESIPNASRCSSAVFVWILAIAISSNLLFGGVSSGALGLIALMTAVLVLLWILDALFSKQFRFTVSPLQLPIIGLIVIGFIQLLPISSHGIGSDLLSIPAVSTLSVSPFATRLAVVKLIIFFVFFSAALTYLDSAKRMRITVFVIIVFGALLSFLGILQALSNPELILWLRQVSDAIPFATYVNRHHFAAFLEMTIALTLGLLFAGSTKPDKRLLLIIAVVMMGLGIVFTTSRGAMISLVAILGMLTALTYYAQRSRSGKKRKRSNRSRVSVLIGANILLVVFLLVSVAWIGGSDLVLRGTGLTSSEDFSSGRLDFWASGLKIAAENPVLGSGLDTFGVAYTKFDTWNGTLRVEHAHNDYLEMLSDGGILALLCVGAFIFFLFRKSLEVIRTTPSSYRRGIAAGALAGCFGILVHSFFDFPLRTNANMFFFLICAVLATVPMDFPDVGRRKKSRIDNRDGTKVPDIVEL